MPTVFLTGHALAFRTIKSYQGTRRVIIADASHFFVKRFHVARNSFSQHASAPLNFKDFSLCIDNFLQNRVAF
jgi:hypothetical protein